MLAPQTIKVIFTNLLFVIGVIITVIGFVHSTSTVAKLILFEQYPLGYEEDCRTLTRPIAVEEKTPIISKEEQQHQEESCRSRLELQRQERKVSDITTSISTFIAGGVIILTFRRFIFS